MPPKPWEQQPAETKKQYQAFCAYRDSGIDRDYRGTYRLVYGHEAAVNVPGWFQKWAKKNKWLDRARAYDASLQSVHLAAVEQVTADLAGGIAQRRAAIFEQVLSGAEDLVRKAKQIGAFPVSRTTTKGKNGETVIVEPINTRNLADVATVYKSAMDLFETIAPTSDSDKTPPKAPIPEWLVERFKQNEDGSTDPSPAPKSSTPSETGTRASRVQ